MQQSKRNFLKVLGAGALSVPLFGLMGCGGSGNAKTTTLMTVPTTPITPPSFATTPWLSGTTAQITDNFPADSLFLSSNTCQVKMVPTTTEGPCYYAVINKEDISEGYSGVPMMICLQITDNLCQPLQGYEVEVWHTDARGIYSGDTRNSSDSARFDLAYCTNDDQAAKTHTWFRGTLVTDANGRVNFKSCFPGWYPRRTIHVHFRVRKNNVDSLVSQLSFPDEVCDNICTNIKPYSLRGKQDTTLATDNILNNNNASALQFEVKQNTDGSLLAYKTLQLN